MNLAPVMVPNGFDRDGCWMHQLWLRPWDGHDETALLSNEFASTAARMTALLSRCVFLDADGTSASLEFARRLQVGDREALMLHLRRLTLGDDISCALDCGSCGEALELELSTDSFLLPLYGHRSWEHDAILRDENEEAGVRFRLPNGADQEAVAALAAVPDQAVAVLVERCVLEETVPSTDELSEKQVEELAHAMAKLDPQAEVLLSIACPNCGEMLSSLLDAAHFVSEEISGSSDQLHREIHVLAYHYHWSASEILGMTGKQRRTYIRHLADALSEGRTT